MVYLISAKKQCGKDTFADILVKEHKFIRIAFADRVKELVVILLNSMGGKINGRKITLEDCYKNKETPLSLPHTSIDRPLRYYLQTFGTEYVRNCINLNYWIDYVINKIRKEYKGTNVVVPDCRFPNEVITMQQAFGINKVKTIRIKRKTGFKDSHSSENAITKWADSRFNYIIDNNGTIEDLKNQVKSILY